jgi:IclR family KDG regulon transcriptional repressor
VSTTVEKALKVLELLSTHGQPVRLADLSRQLEMNKSTTYRLLEKMGQLGYVRQDEDSRYMLTTRMWAIGVRAFRNFDLRAWARKHLEDLARETGETAVLAVLEGTDVVIIDKRDSDHAVQTMSPLGSRSPLHTSSLGKALLLGDYDTLWPQMKKLTKFTDRTVTSLLKLKAEIEKARTTGVTEAFDEHNLGVSGIAAPIHGVDGALLGTVGITLPSARVEDAHMDQIREAVRAHAKRLSRALSGVS